MSRVPSLNSPFLLGFDEIERALDRVTRTASDGYPPYNIERMARTETSPERLRITLAVAGFTQDELEILIEEGQLVIRGRQGDGPERHFLHRGIAARQFQRVFLLAEGMQVDGASLENGLLAIDLIRPEPEGGETSKNRDAGLMVRTEQQRGPNGTARRRKMIETMTKTEKPEPFTPEQFAHLGQGAIAYVRPIQSEEFNRLFPQAQAIQPGLSLFALLGADGTPILLTESRETAIANAWQNELQPVSLH